MFFLRFRGFNARIFISGKYFPTGEGESFSVFFPRQREEISDGAFRRLARRCELELLYRVAKADSLGRNAPWVPRARWYTSGSDS